MTRHLVRREIRGAQGDFRALFIERWDTLQAEYAQYREGLLCCIAADVLTATKPALAK